MGNFVSVSDFKILGTIPREQTQNSVPEKKKSTQMCHLEKRGMKKEIIIEAETKSDTLERKGKTKVEGKIRKQ